MVEIPTAERAEVKRLVAGGLHFVTTVSQLKKVGQVLDFR
jgi:hypothetical protein